MINNILLVILSFFGLVIGIIIAHFTKEELKPGEKYFNFLKKFLMIVIILIFLYYSRDKLLFLLLGVILGFLLRLNVYFYLGLAIASSFVILQELLLASLIFIFGLPYGTLKAKENMKRAYLKRLVLKHLIFFSIPFLIFLFKPLFEIAPGLIIGGLIYNIIQK